MVGRLTFQPKKTEAGAEKTGAEKKETPSGGAGRIRQSYAPRNSGQRKIQKTLRGPKVLFEEIEAHAISLNKSFQLYAIELLIMAWCDAHPETKVEPEAGGSLRLIGLVPLAELLGVTPRTTQNWSHEKGADPFPTPASKDGKSFLYDRDAVLAWAERNRGLTPKGHLARIEADRQRLLTATAPTPAERETQALRVRDAFGTATDEELVRRVTTEVITRIQQEQGRTLGATPSPPPSPLAVPATPQPAGAVS